MSSHSIELFRKIFHHAWHRTNMACKNKRYPRTDLESHTQGRKSGLKTDQAAPLTYLETD